MAEGAVPLEQQLQAIDNEDLRTLELLFARDLVTYVMRRRVPFWDFENAYGGPAPVTPFSFRVRNAIEYYLNKEDINIYVLFAQGFKGLPLDYRAFVLVANYMVDSVYPNVNTPNDLLRLIAVFGQYTVLAYKRGIHMAPHYAIIGIQDVICRYLRQKGIRARLFFAELGTHAEYLIRETPVVTETE